MYIIRYWFRCVKWFFQRGVRGWAPIDTWAFDEYLLKIMEGGLAYLRKTQHGYPASLTEKEWDRRLGEMIWSFQFLLDEGDIWSQDCRRIGVDQADKNKEINEKRAKEGLKIFIEHFADLWD